MNALLDHPPGGFMPPTLPSPPSSSITSPSQNPSTLPHPRAHPLKPGSAKESGFISFVDQGILNVTRRYAKRFSAQLEDRPGEKRADVDAAGRGYEDFGEVARDLEELVDVVWVSGTRNQQTAYIKICAETRADEFSGSIAALQISYLLNLASLLDEYLPSFAFTPRPTFRLLRKIDVAFSSLLQGRDVETGEVLPGFAGGARKVSQTEKVRVKGVVERTRVHVVEVAGKGGGSVNGMAQESATEDSNLEDVDISMTEDEGEDVDMDGSGEHASWEMEVARVYERTIVELGESLGV